MAAVLLDRASAFTPELDITTNTVVFWLFSLAEQGLSACYLATPSLGIINVVRKDRPRADPIDAHCYRKKNFSGITSRLFSSLPTHECTIRKN